MNWLGEYERMQRAGAFIVNLEKRINSIAGEELLTWETNLHKGKKHMKYHYHSTLLFFSVVGILSSSLGIYISDIHHYFKILLLIVEFGAIIGLYILFIFRLKQCYSKYYNHD